MVMKKIVKRELGLDPEIWFERKRTEGRVTRTEVEELNDKLNNSRLEIKRNFCSVRAAASWNTVLAEFKQTVTNKNTQG